MDDIARFRGRVDGHNEVEIVGWAIDMDEPDSTVMVEISDNNGQIVVGYANIFRQDLVDNGLPSGKHGFRLKMPEISDRAKVLTVRFLENRNVIPGGLIYLDADSALLTTKMPDSLIVAMQALAGNVRSQHAKMKKSE